jgi:hypothetical protein
MLFLDAVKFRAQKNGDHGVPWSPAFGEHAVVRLKNQRGASQ